MIWAVYNGWMGNGPVAVLVEAPDEALARVAGESALRAAKPEHVGESYYAPETLRVELLEMPAHVELDVL